MSTHIKQIADQFLRKVRASTYELSAICPFHRKPDGSEERDPSFTMNAYSGLWICHSCHASGNLYTFLRDIGIPRAEIDLRYRDVLEEAKSHSPEKPDPLRPKEPTDEAPLPESFLGLFDYCPTLLLDEGYPEELLRHFDIGFDQQHMRITFPLRDRRGALIGISGRTVIDAHPRYKIYDYEYADFGLPVRKTLRGALLWNVHDVIARMQFISNPAERYVVVSEGFKSTMRIFGGGAMNTVGVMGSDLSDEQLWMLIQLGCPVYLMYDNNEAGQRGTQKVGKKLSRHIPHVLVTPYEADQPSDLAYSDILPALAQAIPFTLFMHQQVDTSTP